MNGVIFLAWFVNSLLSGGAAEETVIQQRVDLIELNHFLDNTGRHVFDQVVFYQWSEEQQIYHVKAWRLVKSPRQLPQRQWNPDRYRCLWHDDGVLREVWAPLYRETWSQKDPERVNRQWLAEKQRVELRKPRRAGLH